MNQVGQGQTILVTGATGFLGRHICPILIKKGFNLKIVCRGKVDLYDSLPNLKVIYTNDLFFESKDWWIKHLKGVDKILHLAWYVEHQKYWDSPNNISCLEGSITLAKAALDIGISHFVGVGTCAEYEDSPGIKGINTALNPKSLYAATKSSTYFILRSLFEGSKTSFTWCRLFYLWGEGEDSGRFVSKLHIALENNKIFTIENGSLVRDYLHVTDAAENLVNTIVRGDSGPVNICSGYGVSLSDLAMNIASKLGKSHLLYINLKEGDKPSSKSIIGAP